MTFLHIFLAASSSIPCFWQWILASLGAFLLGWLLDWLFNSRVKQARIQTVEAENATLKTQIDNLTALKYKLEQSEDAVSALKKDLYKCQSDNEVLKFKLEKAGQSQTTTGETTARGIADLSGTSATSGATGISYHSIFTNDQLQIVEGIGPKIEQLLKDAGILTWSSLAATSVDRLKEILENAGSRYKIHDPQTWPEQARLAASGQWENLIAFQKQIDVNKPNALGTSMHSKIEKMGMKILGFSNDPEDLKVIEGIGPKIETLLKNAGINTWSDVAKSSVENLQEVLDKAGESFRLADPNTWPKQASLAASGKWSELSEYQEFLDGGKEPGK